MDEPTKIGELDGWTMYDHGGNALSAKKAGQRPILCAGGNGTPPAVVRQRLMEAMAEVDGLAAGGEGSTAPARSGTIGHAATIVAEEG